MVLPEAVYCCFTFFYYVYCYDCGVFIEKRAYTKCHLDWLLYELVTWPYMSLL